MAEVINLFEFRKERIEEKVRRLHRKLLRACVARKRKKSRKLERKIIRQQLQLKSMADLYRA